jgi:hypothetical protein
LFPQFARIYTEGSAGAGQAHFPREIFCTRVR